jgi:hypothetical protein
MCKLNSRSFCGLGIKYRSCGFNFGDLKKKKIQVFFGAVRMQVLLVHTLLYEFSYVFGT